MATAGTDAPNTPAHGKATRQPHVPEHASKNVAADRDANATKPTHHRHAPLPPIRGSRASPCVPSDSANHSIQRASSRAEWVCYYCGKTNWQDARQCRSCGQVKQCQAFFPVQHLPIAWMSWATTQGTIVQMQHASRNWRSKVWRSRTTKLCLLSLPLLLLARLARLPQRQLPRAPSAAPANAARPGSNTFRSLPLTLSADHRLQRRQTLTAEAARLWKAAADVEALLESDREGQADRESAMAPAILDEQPMLQLLRVPACGVRQIFSRPFMPIGSASP